MKTYKITVSADHQRVVELEKRIGESHENK